MNGELVIMNGVLIIKIGMKIIIVGEMRIIIITHQMTFGMNRKKTKIKIII